MNYLQRYFPEDYEKMQMVALKFKMFRELAKSREDQARRDLSRIKPKHLGMQLQAQDYNSVIKIQEFQCVPAGF